MITFLIRIMMKYVLKEHRGEVVGTLKRLLQDVR